MQRKTVQSLGFILAVVIGQCALGQEHKPINVGTAHGLPFSDGMVVENTLYMAGQGGDDESGQPVPGGIAAETKAALANLEKVAKAAGFEMKDIVSVTIYPITPDACTRRRRHSVASRDARGSTDSFQKNCAAPSRSSSWPIADQRRFFLSRRSRLEFDACRAQVN